MTQHTLEDWSGADAPSAPPVDDDAGSAAGAGEPCPHGPDARRVRPVPSPHHVADRDPWAGRHPVYCTECRGVVARLEPDEIE